MGEYSGNDRFGDAPIYWRSPYLNSFPQQKAPNFKLARPRFVGVIGGREMDREPVWLWMEENINPMLDVVVTGDGRGADTHAYDFCRLKGVVCNVIPAAPLWDFYGRAAGMIRNPIIAYQSDVIYAFPDPASRGTYETADFAEDLGKKVHYPFGEPRRPQSEIMDFL